LKKKIEKIEKKLKLSKMNQEGSLHFIGQAFHGAGTETCPVN
jgi:hypothetical protein